MRNCLNIYLITTLLCFTGALSVYGQEDTKQPISGSQIYSVYDPNAPTQKQNSLQLGLQYYRNQEYDKSASVFGSLYEDDPTHTNYTYYLYSLIGKKDFRDAEKLVKKQIRNFPGNVRYQIDLGYLYVTLGEVKKGRKVYRDAIESLPADQRTIKDLANSFVGKRENDLAMETYIKGRELLQGTYGFENELAALYYRMEQFEKMVETYLSLAENDVTKISYVQNRLQYYMSNDTDGSIHEALRSQLLKSVQKNPDERFFADFLLWLAIQEKDYEMALRQAKALDKRFDQTGNIVFNIATLSTSANRFSVAEEAFQYILKNYEGDPIYESSLSGYAHSSFMNYKLLSNELKTERKEEMRIQLEDAVEGVSTANIAIRNYRDLAEFYCFYDFNPERGIEILNTILEDRLVKSSYKQEVKLDLADIYLFSGDPWEATLLLSQVEKANKNEPIGHEAKLRNARLSYYIGEYGWAEGQLDILKAATSKLIANDAMNLYLFISENKDNDTLSPALDVFAQAELLVFRRLYTKATALLDSLYNVSSAHPIADDILYKKGEIAVLQGDDILADSLFSMVHEYFPKSILADDAIMQQIHIAKRQNNEQKAASLNEKILFDYPASIFAVEARQEFRAWLEEKRAQETIPLPQMEQ
ncbi:MAG: hypothetical protein C0593_02485 [Marinilabiliales bacterium]|nr:MAG: hypothetical protein C0593_02485 [Marinilabiliales bacterium]